MTIAGEDAGTLIGDVKLNAVNVEFDLMDPSRTRGFSIELASAGSMKPVKGTLVQTAAGFLRWTLGRTLPGCP